MQESGNAPTSNTEYSLEAQTWRFGPRTKCSSRSGGRNSVCLGREDMGECQQADDLEPWWRSVDGGTAIWRSWLEELTLSDIIHRVGGPIAAVGSHFTVPVAHIADYYPSHHG